MTSPLADNSNSDSCRIASLDERDQLFGLDGFTENPSFAIKIGYSERIFLARFLAQRFVA